MKKIRVATLCGVYYCVCTNIPQEHTHKNQEAIKHTTDLSRWNPSHLSGFYYRSLVLGSVLQRASTFPIFYLYTLYLQLPGHIPWTCPALTRSLSACTNSSESCVGAPSPEFTLGCQHSLRCTVRQRLQDFAKLDLQIDMKAVRRLLSDIIIFSII